MSVFLLLSSLFCKESLVLGNHFRAAPIRDKAAIRTPRIAQRPLDPSALSLRPFVPTHPRNRFSHPDHPCRISCGTQIVNPPSPKMTDIMGALNTVCVGMFLKSFHGSLIRTVSGRFFPLIIFVPSIGPFRKFFVRFNVLNSVFRKFRIKEILPPKVDMSSLMNRQRARPLSFSLGVKGEQDCE